MSERPKCPKCGGETQIRKPKPSSSKKFIPFYGCTDYPSCDGVAPIPGLGALPRCLGHKMAGAACNSCYASTKCAKVMNVEAPTCPKCGRVMAKRSSIRGDFWGCSGFPDCRGTEKDGGHFRHVPFTDEREPINLATLTRSVSKKKPVITPIARIEPADTTPESRSEYPTCYNTHEQSVNFKCDACPWESECSPYFEEELDPEPEPPAPMNLEALRARFRKV